MFVIDIFYAGINKPIVVAPSTIITGLFSLSSLALARPIITLGFRRSPYTTVDTKGKCSAQNKKEVVGLSQRPTRRASAKSLKVTGVAAKLVEVRLRWEIKEIRDMSGLSPVGIRRVGFNQ